MKDMTRHKNAVHYGMKIKWNSRKYKEKTGKLKPKNNVKKEDSENYSKKKAPQMKLEESNVTYIESNETYIETVETTGEEIIAMGGLEGQTVILDSGAVSVDLCFIKESSLICCPSGSPIPPGGSQRSSRRTPGVHRG